MKFNKFDRVECEHLGFGVVVGYTKAGSCLVCFDEKLYNYFHDGNKIDLVCGNNTADLQLPDRCYYVDEEQIKLVMKHKQRVEYIDHLGVKKTGIYISTGMQKYRGRLLIESDSFYEPFPGNLLSLGKSLSTVCDMCKLVKIDINKVNAIEESKMKYVAKKTIVGSEIVEYDPCRTEFEKFVREYGYFNEVEWSKEIEEKFETEDGWISFLITKGFLEKNAEFEFDETKIYCFSFPYSRNIFKIIKYCDNDSFAVGCVNNTASYASTVQNRDPKSWNELVKYLTDSEITIRKFDSMSEACVYYNI